MELLLLSLALGGAWFVNKRSQLRRIHLLAGILGQFQVERLMETVADGYLRALGEKDPQRSQQVWGVLDQAEITLRDQIRSFADMVTKLDAAPTRFSTLPIAVPYAVQLFPQSSADLRALLRIHSEGVDRLVRNEAGLAQRDKAYMLTAELLLLQHSCHWFCRSKAVATARMMARHRTPHAQLVASVSEQTRQAYNRLMSA
ncbi:hypothetical protein [Rhodoferax sp. GW822-FHT02A01]|uniref:hypothetical protein n=1 Tax=Rhodoferax sp. GW822-FHT02A01 TaxID=3141537 RepID=UPI00315C5995